MIGMETGKKLYRDFVILRIVKHVPSNGIKVITAKIEG